MDFKIIIFEGTDSIKFGMARNEIQRILGKVPKLFKKDEFAREMTEDYHDICHVHYDGDVCAFIEFFEPSQVFFNGVNLLGKRIEEVEPLFSSLPGYNSFDGACFSAYDDDFSCYVETVGDNDYDTVAAVGISRKGYAAEQSEYYEKCYAEKYKI